MEDLLDIHTAKPMRPAGRVLGGLAVRQCHRAGRCFGRRRLRLFNPVASLTRCRFVVDERS